MLRLFKKPKDMLVFSPALGFVVLIHLQAVDKSILSICVAFVVGSLQLNGFWCHTSELLSLVSIDCCKCEAISSITTESGNGETQGDKEGDAVSWPVICTIDLCANHSSQIAEAVDTKDQGSLARLFQNS